MNLNLIPQLGKNQTFSIADMAIWYKLGLNGLKFTGMLSLTFYHLFFASVIFSALTKIIRILTNLVFTRQENMEHKSLGHHTHLLLVAKLLESLNHQLLAHTVYSATWWRLTSYSGRAEVLVLLGRHAKLPVGSTNQSQWNTVFKYSRWLE